MSPIAALDLSVYVVTDPLLSLGRSHEEVAEAAFAGGASVVQLRDKDASTDELYRYGLAVQDAAARHGALFIVNDRVDLAQAIDAGGLHVGQEDMPASLARELIGEDKVLGVSVENGEQAAEAERAGASYVAIGPIYEARGTKSDAGPPVGPEAITEIRRHTRLPVVAIGGIKHGHVGEVIRAGASGIAVISAVVGAPDIAAAAGEMRRLVELAREGV